MERETRRLLAVLLVVAVGTACQAKREVDQKVDGLIGSLQRTDYAAFKALSSPEMSSVVPEAKFKRFAKLAQRLGAYQKRSMHGIGVEAGGVHKGTYTVTFAKGEAELEVTTSAGLVTAFNLTGDSVRQAMSEIEAEEQAVFKVESFQFLDETKQAKPSNVYKLGAEIRFTMVVFGMTLREGSLHVKCRLRVLDADKVTRVDKPLLDQELRPEEKRRVVTINGSLKIPVVASEAGAAAKAGSYRLQLTVTDVFGGERTLEHAQAFIVE